MKRRSVQLQIHGSSVQRILKKDLHYHPYKITIVQHLNPADDEKRVQFAQFFLEIFREENKIDLLMMSDEAHFHMNGFINKQNFRHWATENPQIMQEKTLHPQRVTVWCAIMHDRVIGPYFLKTKKVSQRL